MCSKKVDVKHIYISYITVYRVNRYPLISIDSAKTKIFDLFNFFSTTIHYTNTHVLPCDSNHENNQNYMFYIYNRQL